MRPKVSNSKKSMALRHERDIFQRNTMVTLVHFCRNSFLWLEIHFPLKALFYVKLGSRLLPAMSKLGRNRGTSTSHQVKFKMSAKSAEFDETGGLPSFLCPWNRTLDGPIAELLYSADWQTKYRPGQSHSSNNDQVDKIVKSHVNKIGTLCRYCRSESKIPPRFSTASNHLEVFYFFMPAYDSEKKSS